jgi:hypothetical protein
MSIVNLQMYNIHIKGDARTSRSLYGRYES